MNFWLEERIPRWNFELVFLFGIFNGIDSGSLTGSIVLAMFGGGLDIYYLEILLLGMFFIVSYPSVETRFYFLAFKPLSNDRGGGWKAVCAGGCWVCLHGSVVSWHRYH